MRLIAQIVAEDIGPVGLLLIHGEADHVVIEHAGCTADPTCLGTPAAFGTAYIAVRAVLMSAECQVLQHFWQ